MKTFMKSLFAIILLIPVLLNAQAKVGTSAAAFLGMDVGPVATALGGTQVAVAKDASSIYWNPGASAQLPQTTLQFSSTDWFIDTRFDYAAAVLKLNSSNALGFSFISLDYGEEEVTTEFDQDGTNELWTASDLALSLNYARMLTDRFSIGGSAKYIQQKIWREAATSMAFDVGILFRTQMDGLQIGMSISNFGPSMTLDGPDLLKRIDIDPENLGHNETLVARLKVDTWSLPLIFRLGLSYKLNLGNAMSLLLLSDAIVPSDNVEVLNLGAEFNMFDRFYLRGGMRNIGNDDNLLNYSLGGGLRLNLSDYQAAFDYSLQEYEYFGMIPTIGIVFAF